MPIIRNILATIGLATVIIGGVGYYKVHDILNFLDPEAVRVYQKVGIRFLQNFDPGAAIVEVVPAKKGMKPEEVVDSLKSLAVQRNILFVGESPFYKQAQAVLGKPYRFVSFLSFCDVRVGVQMADYNRAYTAFMPCRIAVVQDKDDPEQVYLTMMDLDMFIFGGKTLPPELKANAIKVRDTLRALMEGAAQGQF
ncbi:DUF302 domain-containing protein [Gammaproteobacteria bacterium]